MRTYMPDTSQLYPDAEVRIVPSNRERAVVQVSDQNLNTIWFPRENDGGWVTDGSILFTNCMGFDPEEFDPESPKTKEWVDRFSYPVETAEEIVKQINAEAKGW